MLVLRILWSISRFVKEAVYDAVCPREFVTVTNGYLGSWLFGCCTTVTKQKMHRVA